MNKFYTLFFAFFVGISFSYGQCTTENSIGCECKDSDEIACDLESLKKMYNINGGDYSPGHPYNPFTGKPYKKNLAFNNRKIFILIPS